MKRNRKQEIARYRSGLAAKALAASLLLAASSLPALGAQTVDDLTPLDRTKDITITGQRSGTADVPGAAPDIVKTLFPIMGGGAVSFAPFSLNPVNGAVTITDNRASGSVALGDVFNLLGFKPPAGLDIGGSVGAGLGGGLASISDIDLAADGDVVMRGNSAAAEESGTVTLTADLDKASGGGVKGTLKAESSVSLAAGGAAAAIMGSTAIVSNNGAVDLSSNSASASGGIAAAMGGGAFGPHVFIAGENGVSVTGNSASAQAASPLKASVEALDAGSVKADAIALEGSLAVAGGGAAAAMMGSTVIVSNNGAVDLSSNSASASGSLAAAMGGGAFGTHVAIDGANGVSVTGNSASAQADSPLKVSVDGLEAGPFKAASAALEGSLAVAAGGAAAAIRGSTTIVSGGGAVDLSSNSASASGSLAAALGGGAFGPHVFIAGENGVSVTGNSASAQADSPLKVSVDGLEAGPFKAASAALEGSLAVAAGGAAAAVGGPTLIVSNNGAADFSSNSASASGALALAAGGGLAASDNIDISAKSAALTGNSAAAASNGNLELAIEGLALDGKGKIPELNVQKGALRLPLAAAAGGAGMSLKVVQVNAVETVELSGNSAAASGGIAAAMGGGLAGFGGVYLTGPEGISVTGNAAQAAAQNFELLKLDGVSVTYDDDADPATPNYRQSLESLSLQGSLAAALGGGVFGGVTRLDAGGETLALNGNAAAASGGIAAAAGGGFADFGGAALMGKTVEMKDNAVAATAEGGLSLDVKGLDLDLGFVKPDMKVSLGSASLKLPVAAAAGGAGMSRKGVQIDAGETIELSGNSAAASGGIAAALGGGLAGSAGLNAPEDVSITNNTAFAKAAGGAELNVEGLELEGVLPLPVSIGKLEGRASIAAALGGAIAGSARIETEDLVVADNAALAQGGLAAAIGGAGTMEVKDPGTGDPVSAQFRSNRAEALGSEKASLSVAGLKLGLPGLPPELNASVSGSVAAAIGGAGSIKIRDLPNGGSVLFEGNLASADGSLAAALGGAAVDFDTRDPSTAPDEEAFTRNRALARNSTGIPLTIEGDALKELAVKWAEGKGSSPDEKEAYKALAKAVLNARSIAFAAGGALFNPTDIFAKREINFVGNEAAAEGGLGVALGGAVASTERVDIESGGNITFAGNRVSGSTLALGGAVYTVSDLKLTAPNGRVAFMSAGDDAVFGGDLTVASETLLGVKGVALLDQKSALAEAGMPENVAGLLAPAGGAADLTQVETVAGEKGEPGGLFRVAADTVDLKADSEAMVLGAAGDGRHYFMTVESPAVTGGDAFQATRYRSASVGFDVDGDARHYYIDVKDSKDLVWNGTSAGNGDLWGAGTVYPQNWKDGAADEHFYNADRVVFNDAAEETVVSVIDPMVLPGAMTVAGTKDYAFATAAGSPAPYLIGTPSLALTGSGKTAFAGIDVAVTESFTAGAGSKLVVDETRAAGGMAAVRGTGSAALNVEKGAALMVQDAELNIPYRIADGFAGYGSVMNWDAQPYEGTIFDQAALAYTPEDTWGPITKGYVTLWDEGTVTFSDRFRMESDPAALLSLANSALTVSRSFAGSLNARVSSRQNAEGDLSGIGRMNFVPEAGAPAADKGVWGSIWYGHSDVDGMTVAGAKGVFEQDSTTKSYGATIGGDFTRRGFTTGLAVQLGKYDIDGANGSDADGKFIGVGLYGGFKRGNWEFTGDIGYNWFDTDVAANLSGGSFRADGVKGRVATAGVRADWKLPARGAVQVTPFLGLRFSHYDQDAYDMTGSFIAQGIRSEDASLDQWTLPLGVRFDWNLKNRGDWTLKPSLEIAYVRAFGDTDIDSRLRFLGSGSTLPAMDFTSAVTDKDSFRTALQLEGKRRNMTLGLNLSGQFSSNQKDLGVGATVRWDF